MLGLSMELRLTVHISGLYNFANFREPSEVSHLDILFVAKLKKRKEVGKGFVYVA